MAVRRARIKAVASIPVRRKDTKTEKVAKVATPKPSKDGESQSNSNERVQNVITETTSSNIIDKFAPFSIPSSKDERNHISSTISQSENAISDIIKPRTVTADKSHIELPKKSIKSPAESINTYIRKSPANLNFTPAIEKEKNTTIIDGITPLPVSERINTRSLNIVNLQNPQILSAECNFDPFVPLPSPTKNRPKLRPTPCIATRRNSFQGSASESEDELKKNKREEVAPSIIPTPQPQPVLSLQINNRRRNDSVCSLPGDPTMHTSSVPLTPRQKIPVYKGNASYMRELRKAAVRRKVYLKDPQNPLTMCDLIYYNPPNYDKKPNKNITPEEVRREPIIQNTENVVDKPENKSNPIPVPQVKLGANGQIIIDEQSLVIETTDTVKSRTELSKLAVVYESGLGPSTGGTYRRTMRTREWSAAETLRFYKALNTVGTDFALMLSFFPGRTRRDLKVKFKREEKHNMKLVDKALMNPLNFDVSELEKPIPDEEIISKVQKKKEKSAVKVKPNRKSYRKSSIALRSIGMDPTEIIGDSSNNYNTRNKIVVSNKSPDIAVSQRDVEMSDRSTSTPNTMLPPNIEPGSLVLSVEKVPGKSTSTLQAYLPQVIEGKTQMIPINLDIEMLKSIAKEMNIEQSNNL